MVSAGYAVVDVETTGLFAGKWNNRVAEIGIVLVDRDGVVTDEWCTLVNPERDLGPQHIHGIRAADILAAPTFAQVAGDVAELLDGRVVVAHNLGFDAKFLCHEFERLGFPVPAGHEFGLCTMDLAQRHLRIPSRSLAACCAYLGIRQVATHSALHDARAAAEVLGYVLRAVDRPEPWHGLFSGPLAWPRMPGCGRTVRRGEAVQRQTFLARLVERLPHVPELPHADEYLALLDRALLDRHLSVSEQDALLELAESLGISVGTAVDLHRRYLAALARAAWEDGVVTDAERDDLDDVATLLGLAPADVAHALRDARTAETPRWERFRLSPGDIVAFTGQLSRDRGEWEDRAVTVGLSVAPNGVTKRTRLLVAADPDSLSGKAGKARGYGIPIVTEDAFGDLLDRLAAGR